MFIYNFFLSEVTSPPVPFDSLSPGDVESISEGEIPEAEGEGEVEGMETAAGAPPTPPPVSSPQPEDHSLEAEQFEPILSDEEIADDSDPQVKVSYMNCYSHITRLRNYIILTLSGSTSI